MKTATAAPAILAAAAAPETIAPQIAVLDRGFVYIGYCSLDGDILTISRAQNIRRWGTSNGLGELALKGPQPNTKINEVGTVRAPRTAVIHLIDAPAESWPAVLKPSV